MIWLRVWLTILDLNEEFSTYYQRECALIESFIWDLSHGTTILRTFMCCIEDQLHSIRTYVTDVIICNWIVVV